MRENRDRRHSLVFSMNTRACVFWYSMLQRASQLSATARISDGKMRSWKSSRVIIGVLNRCLSSRSSSVGNTDRRCSAVKRVWLCTLHQVRLHVFCWDNVRVEESGLRWRPIEIASDKQIRIQWLASFSAWGKSFQ